MKKTKVERGITLIALTIIIVVLLILTIVAIWAVKTVGQKNQISNNVERRRTNTI